MILRKASYVMVVGVILVLEAWVMTRAIPSSAEPMLQQRAEVGLNASPPDRALSISQGGIATGFWNPSANSPVTSGSGDNNGFEVSPTNVYANDATFAVDNNSGTGKSTSCTSNNRDRHLFYNYNISLPTGSTIEGIEVRLDAKADSGIGLPAICVELSWNGGVSWTGAKATPKLTKREATYVLGSNTDTWGHTWDTSELSNTSFLVRVVTTANSTARDFWLDWLAVNVTYTPNDPPDPPANPNPAAGATDVNLAADISWTGSDPNGDAVTYDVYFEADDATPDVLVSNDQSGTTYDPGTLSANTHYYWQVVATDEHAAVTPGPIWDFTTGSGGTPGERVLIPAGEFQMGCDPAHNGGYECYSWELPLHTVYLDAYEIDVTEVTNAQYAGFLNGRGSNSCDGFECIDLDDSESHIFLQSGQYSVESGYSNHPVIEVTWYGANSYCTEGGGRLPTEAEWEKAARGTTVRTYPWGDGDPNCTLANSWNDATGSYCVGDTSAVGSYPAGASPYGALDMAGNVYEWVNDWWSDTYYSSSPYANPPGPDTGTYKVGRGGSWATHWDALRAAPRPSVPPTYSSYEFGFRCASAPG